MFGLGKKNAAANDAEQYMRTLFAGIGALEGKKVPNQVFADPYVAAFLQVLTLHATMIVYKGQMPDQITVAGIMAAAIDKLVPGYGIAIVKGVAEVGNPTHPLHANYMAGCQEGNAYVDTLMREDEVEATAGLLAFREFVSRNYM